MEHNNCQGELQCRLTYFAEMLSYLSVCIRYVVILITTYLQINVAFSCFILPHKFI